MKAMTELTEPPSRLLHSSLLARNWQLWGDDDYILVLPPPQPRTPTAWARSSLGVLRGGDAAQDGTRGAGGWDVAGFQGLVLANGPAVEGAEWQRPFSEDSDVYFPLPLVFNAWQ